MFLGLFRYFYLIKFFSVCHSRPHWILLGHSWRFWNCSLLFARQKVEGFWKHNPRKRYGCDRYENINIYIKSEVLLFQNPIALGETLFMIKNWKSYNLSIIILNTFKKLYIYLFNLQGGMTWWGSFLVVACYTLSSSQEEIRIYPRHANLDNSFACITKVNSQVSILALFLLNLTVRFTFSI